MINRAGAILLTAAVFVLIALFSIFQIQDRREAELRATEAQLQATIAAALNVLSTVKDVETGQRGFLITGRSEYLKPYSEGIRVFEQNVNTLQKLTSDRTDSARIAAVFVRATRLKIDELTATINLRAAGQQGLALARVMQGEGLRYMTQARELDARLVTLEKNRLRETRQQLAQVERFGRISLFVSGAILFLLLTTGTVLLAKEAEREARFAAGLEQSEQRYRRLSESLEQQVLTRTEELVAVNRELEAFSFSVSHDLRAPLRSIDGFSLIILEDYSDKLDEDGRRLLARIRTATARMGQLITSLLELSRVNRTELRREKVSLSSMAGGILDGLRASDPDRTVNVEIHPHLAAECDPELLHIALENLLANAWKFTSKQANACIQIGSTRVDEKSKTAFFVRDNGTGFDPTYVDRLFTPFQRLHSASDFEGIGIGLATVKRVIHRHGGELWATGFPGKGATFFFSLP